MQLEKILAKSSLQAAPLLLGWILVRQTPEGVMKLRIVETEAYHQQDPASHSFRGITPRTAPMFEAGGRLYVYFTYGAHYCLNIVTGPKGVGEAVLVRAAEPLEGIKIMQNNRGVTSIHKIANGPGKLGQSLGIKDTSLSGQKLLNLLSNSEESSEGRFRRPESRTNRKNEDWCADIYLEPPIEQVNPKDIIASPRIGITRATDLPWRFYVKNSPFVSKTVHK